MATLGQIDDNKIISDYLGNGSQAPAPTTPQQTDYYNMSPAPSKKRTTLGEAGRNFYHNAVSQVPEATGKALQFLGNEDISNYGKQMAEGAAKRDSDYQPDLAGRSALGQTFIKATGALPLTIAPIAAGLAGAAIGPVAGTVAGTGAALGLFGGSAAQEKKDALLAKDWDEASANKEAWKEGAIQGVGDAAMQYAGLKMAGVIGKSLKGATLAEKVAAATDTSIAKPFIKGVVGTTAGEAITEAGQDIASNELSRSEGLPTQSNWDIAKESGSVGGMMGAMLSPFGLVGHYKNSVRANAISKALDDPAVATPDQRKAVVDMIHKDAKKAGIKTADSWYNDALGSIATNQPISRSAQGEEEKMKEALKAKPSKETTLPTGEQITIPAAARAYNNYIDLLKSGLSPNSEDYKSTFQAIQNDLNAISDSDKNNGVKAVVAEKIKDIINNSHTTSLAQEDRMKREDEDLAKASTETETADSSSAPADSSSAPADSSSAPAEAPVAPQEQAPVAPQEQAPVAPQEQAPVAPQEQAPVAPQEQAPVAPQEQAPVAPQEQAPVAPQEQAPVAPQEQAPVAPQEQAPVAPQEQAAQEVVEPKTPQEAIDHQVPAVDRMSTIASASKAKSAKVIKTPRATKPKAAKVTKPKVEKVKYKQGDETSVDLTNVPRDRNFKTILDLKIPPDQQKDVKLHVVSHTPSAITGTIQYKNSDGSDGFVQVRLPNSSLNNTKLPPVENEVAKVLQSNKEVVEDIDTIESIDDSDVYSAEDELKKVELLDKPKEVLTLSPSENEELDTIKSRISELTDLIKEFKANGVDYDAESEELVDLRDRLKVIRPVISAEVNRTVSKGYNDEEFIDDYGNHISLHFDDDIDLDVSPNLTDSIDDVRSTLKILNSISPTQKAVNKYSYVKAKLKEINASNEEANTVNDVLKELGEDGKWSWHLFSTLIQERLSEVHSFVVDKNQDFTYYGLDSIFSDDFINDGIGFTLEIGLIGSNEDFLDFPSVWKLKSHGLNSDSIAHVRTFIKDGDFYTVEVQSDVKQSARDFVDIPTDYELADITITTLDSYNDKEYLRNLPYLEKRSVREAFKEAVSLKESNSAIHVERFNLAHIDTLIEIESNSFSNNPKLVNSYKKLSEQMAKELGLELTTDKFGNKWWSRSLPDSYIPLSYSQNNRAPDKSAEVDHVENERAFKYLVDNVSDDIKELVDFIFVKDFATRPWGKDGINPGNSARTAGGMHIAPNKAHPKTRIYINSSMFSNPQDIVGTFAHEVIGHFGLTKFFGGKSKYQSFLANLLNSSEALRNDILKLLPRWYTYLEAWKRINVPGYRDITPESTPYYINERDITYRAYMQSIGSGEKYRFTVPIRGIITELDIPADVASRLADEYMSELAKESFNSEQFLTREVGLGIKSSPARSLLRGKRAEWLDNFIKRVKHYLRAFFGSYTNSISDKDLIKIIASSTDAIFETVNPDFANVSSKPFINTRIEVDEIDEINISGVSLDRQSYSNNISFDQTQLAEDEITHHMELAPIADINAFINLHNSTLGDLSDNVRSRAWKNLNTRLDNSVFAAWKALGNMQFQKAYTAIQDVFKGQVGAAEENVKSIALVLNGLNPIQNQLAFEYMTTKGAELRASDFTPLQIKTLQRSKDSINKIGKSLYELGMVPQDTYEANADSYLHVSYMKYVNEYRGSGKKAGLGWHNKKTKRSERERMAMGQIKDVKFLIPETLGIITRDKVLLDMFSTLNKASVDNNLHWVLTNNDKVKLPWSSRKVTIDRAYELLNDTSFMLDEWSKGNQTTFGNSRERWTTLSSDVQKLKDSIAALENQAVEEAFKHATTTGTTTQVDKDAFLKNHYTRMPNHARFGALRNQWVRKEIYNDLDAMTSSYDLANKTNIEKWFARGGTLERLNTFWKRNMVALNPGSWVRNGLGNLSLLDLSTSTPTSKLIGMLHQEITGGISSKPSYFWSLANQYGLFGSTFSAIELQDVYNSYGDELVNAQKMYEKRTESPWDKHLSFLDERFMATMRIANHKINNKTTKYFSLLEGSFKTVALRDYIQTWEAQNKEEFPKGHKSLSPEQQQVLFTKAAAHANDAIFDYSQVNSMVKVLRRIPFGSPFITFAYKSGPAAIRAMVNHPVKFAKYATLPALMTMVSAAVNDWDDDDMGKYKAALSDYYRNNPGTAFIPFKDKLGRPQIMSLDYIIPWSQWSSAARKVYENFENDGGQNILGTSVKSIGTIANNFGVLGGPTPTAMASYLSGKDGFTGKDIMTPGASPNQQLAESMLFAYNMVTPAWLSSHGWFSKMAEAFGISNEGKPAVTAFGSIKYTPAQAVSDITGFRPVSVDLKSGLKGRQVGFDMQLKELNTLKYRIAHDRNSGLPEKANKIKDLNQRIKLVRTQMQKAMSGNE